MASIGGMLAVCGRKRSRAMTTMMQAKNCRAEVVMRKLAMDTQLESRVGDVGVCWSLEAGGVRRRGPVVVLVYSGGYSAEAVSTVAPVVNRWQRPPQPAHRCSDATSRRPLVKQCKLEAMPVGWMPVNCPISLVSSSAAWLRAGQGADAGGGGWCWRRDPLLVPRWYPAVEEDQR